MIGYVTSQYSHSHTFQWGETAPRLMLLAAEYTFGVPLSLLQWIHSPDFATVFIPGKVSRQVLQVDTCICSRDLHKVNILEWTDVLWNRGWSDKSPLLCLTLFVFPLLTHFTNQVWHGAWSGCSPPLFQYIFFDICTWVHVAVVPLYWIVIIIIIHQNSQLIPIFY